jgi:type III secretion system YscD/HrpQ family protein
MNASDMLELRLHSGTHAGAHEALEAAEYLLGAGPDCDFVLSDADILPKQARLERKPNGWQMQSWDQTGGEPTVAVLLDPGTLYMLGTLVISVAAPQSPWPTQDEIDGLLRLTSATPDLDPTEGQSDSAAAGNDVVNPPSEATARVDRPTEAETHVGAQPAWMTEPRPQAGVATRGLMVPLTGALMCGIVGALLWVVWPGDKVPVLTLAKPAMAVKRMVGLAAIEQAIQTLGLQERVTISEGLGGLPMIRATLLDDEAYEGLAMALSQLNPRPGLEVTTEQQLVRAVQDQLELQAAELKTKLVSTHLGGGKFRLAGNLRDAPERDTLLIRLKETLPPVVTLESALMLPEDLAQSMLAELREAQLGDINGNWRDGRLVLGVRLEPTVIPQWEQLLARVSRKYGVPFSATLTMKSSNQRPGVLATLPFRLQAVVSGDTPYVVLGGGDKVMLQGRNQGWQLVSIDKDSVVFEGAKASRVVVQR